MLALWLSLVFGSSWTDIVEQENWTGIVQQVSWSDTVAAKLPEPKKIKEVVVEKPAEPDNFDLENYSDRLAQCEELGIGMIVVSGLTNEKMVTFAEGLAWAEGRMAVWDDKELFKTGIYRLDPDTEDDGTRVLIFRTSAFMEPNGTLVSSKNHLPNAGEVGWNGVTKVKVKPGKTKIKGNWRSEADREGMRIAEEVRRAWSGGMRSAPVMMRSTYRMSRGKRRGLFGRGKRGGCKGGR